MATHFSTLPPILSLLCPQDQQNPHDWLHSTGINDLYTQIPLLKAYKVMSTFDASVIHHHHQNH